MTVTTLGNNEVESVIRKLIAQLGDAADFHFATKYVDCIVEEYAGKLAAIGAGTCHITPKFTCSECGHQYPTRNYESYETCDGRTAFAPLGYNVLDCKKPNYCPECGRRVK